MKINVNDFTARYCSAEYHHGAFVPEDVFAQISECELNGDVFCEVCDNLFEQIEAAKAQDEQRTALFNDITFHRLQGMKAEDAKDTDTAIREYAEAIRIGEDAAFDMLHAYRHALNRIIVLLARARSYTEEARYITMLLQHDIQDSERSRLLERLEKTNQKIEKAQK